MIMYDLFVGCPMPEFTLPYSAELGSHPTFEEMQVNVSRNKIRPKFPDVWKDYNQVGECWNILDSCPCCICIRIHHSFNLQVLILW